MCSGQVADGSVVGGGGYEEHGGPENVPDPLDPQAAAESRICLTQHEMNEIARMKALLGSRQGNPDGREHAYVSKCCVCSYSKHHVKWAMRSGRRGTSVVTGSWCYSCQGAATNLGVPTVERIVKVLPAVSEKVRHVSLRLRRKMQRYQGDLCCCSNCKRERETHLPRPSKRVRSKSQL